MQAGNILVGVAAAAWFSMAMVGRSLIKGVIEQRALGYPNLSQIDFVLAGPMFVVVVVLLFAWVWNIFRLAPTVLTVVAGILLLALFPYMVLVFGG